MSKEIWKKLDGYKYEYEISNLGNARRKQKKSGLYKQIGYINKGGNERRCITLRQKNGKQYPIQISRLVAKLFLKNPSNLNIVDHIDRNKLNDNVKNLRWATFSENLINSGKRNRNGKNFSIYKGVTRRPLIPNRKKIWQSVLKSNGRNIYIGSFETEEEAAMAYNKMAKKITW